MTTPSSTAPWTVAQTASFMSDLVSAPHETQKKLIKQVLPALLVNPEEPGGRRMKRLMGYHGLWRYALTDPEYRIIYRVDQKARTSTLLIMGPRRDGEIYRRLGYTPEVGPNRIAPEMICYIEPAYVVENPHALAASAPVATGPPTAGTPAPCPSAGGQLALDPGSLREWRVPPEFHEAILACRTDDDLLNAPVPQHIRMRVVDCLYPRPIEQVVSQPAYVVESEADLTRSRDGCMSRLLLALDPEQQAAMDRNKRWPILVKGGPGTGKSIVALYKAASLIKDPQQDMFQSQVRVLFTTFTKSLIRVSRELLNAYLGPGHSHLLDVRTLDSLALRICQSHDGEVKTLHHDTPRREALEAALASLPPQERALIPSALDVPYLLDEFDWVIEGRDLKSEQDYLGADRAGRRVALSTPQKAAIWRLYQAVRGTIGADGTVTFTQVQSRALQIVSESRETIPDADNPLLYDYVFVDEAQDLKPVGLKLCARLARHPAHVYLTADVNQAIYGKSVSWSSVVDSLQFRGRQTIFLRKNYRTTDQIIRASSDLIRGLDGFDPDTSTTEAVHTGPKPIARTFPDPSSRDTAIAEWIRQSLTEHRYPLNAAAVLCTTKQMVAEMVARLTNLGLPAIDFKEAGEIDSPQIKVMTLFGSKGLEFPVVVIPEFSIGGVPWMEAADADGQMREIRRLYFVACTRAMRRLMVCTVGTETDMLGELVRSGNWELG